VEATRPTIRPKDPDREKKLVELRALLERLPADETAVFLDEVDVNLNPKVGCMWLRRDEQAAVETPGTNEKRYLAGSIHGRTGRVILTGGKLKEGRGAALFLRHLDDLRRAFRHYKVIHVICDNAGFHNSQATTGSEFWYSPPTPLLVVDQLTGVGNVTAVTGGGTVFFSGLATPVSLNLSDGSAYLAGGSPPSGATGRGPGGGSAGPWRRQRLKPAVNCHPTLHAWICHSPLPAPTVRRC
jgi:hypothetical protein